MWNSQAFEYGYVVWIVFPLLLGRTEVSRKLRVLSQYYLCIYVQEDAGHVQGQIVAECIVFAGWPINWV